MKRPNTSFSLWLMTACAVLLCTAAAAQNSGKTAGGAVLDGPPPPSSSYSPAMPCGKLPGCGNNPIPEEALVPPQTGQVHQSSDFKAPKSNELVGNSQESDDECACKPTDKCCLNSSPAMCWRGRPKGSACFDTGSRTNPRNEIEHWDYRDSMYSQDFVVDYLDRYAGLKSDAGPKGGLAPRYILKTVLPRYWYPYDALSKPVPQLEFIRANLVDLKLDNPGIYSGKTVAVILSDRYYRGHAGMVWLFDKQAPNGPCVYVRSKNWLKYSCQRFTKENCYQSYDSFLPDTPATNSKCLPLSRISFMFNYNYERAQTDGDVTSLVNLAKECDAAKKAGSGRNYADESCKTLCGKGYETFCK